MPYFGMPYLQSHVLPRFPAFPQPEVRHALLRRALLAMPYFMPYFGRVRREVRHALLHALLWQVRRALLAMPYSTMPSLVICGEVRREVRREVRHALLHALLLA